MDSRISSLAVSLDASKVLLFSAVPKILLGLLRARESTLTLRVSIRGGSLRLLAGLRGLIQILSTAPTRVNSVRRTIRATRVSGYARVNSILRTTRTVLASLSENRGVTLLVNSTLLRRLTT